MPRLKPKLRSRPAVTLALKTIRPEIASDLTYGISIVFGELQKVQAGNFVDNGSQKREALALLKTGMA